jgi:hypothetical protein
LNKTNFKSPIEKNFQPNSFIPKNVYFFIIIRMGP